MSSWWGAISRLTLTTGCPICSILYVTSSLTSCCTDIFPLSVISAQISLLSSFQSNSCHSNSCKKNTKRIKFQWNKLWFDRNKTELKSADMNERIHWTDGQGVRLNNYNMFSIDYRVGKNNNTNVVVSCVIINHYILTFFFYRVMAL